MSEELIEETKHEDVHIEFTLNAQEWIPALSFRYHELKITRLSFAKDFGEGLDEE